MAYWMLIMDWSAGVCSSYLHKRERDVGVWCAQGGTNRLVAGLVTQFERLGGTLRLGDPVTGIATLGERATGVTTASGWTAEADAVASNADVKIGRAHV